MAGFLTGSDTIGFAALIDTVGVTDAQRAQFLSEAWKNPDFQGKSLQQIVGDVYCRIPTPDRLPVGDYLLYE